MCIKRYVLKTGKYGIYFYDIHYKTDLTLNQVLELINTTENDKEINKEIQQNIEILFKAIKTLEVLIK